MAYNIALQTLQATTKPKRPPNPFIAYGNEMRVQIRQELTHAQALLTNDIAKPKAVATELGRRWKSLHPQDQAKWRDAYKQAFALYKTEQNEWRGKRDVLKQIQQQIDVANNVIQVPKKPANAYMKYQASTFHKVREELKIKQQALMAATLASSGAPMLVAAQSNVPLPAKTVVAEIASRWKALPEAVRDQKSAEWKVSMQYYTTQLKAAQFQAAQRNQSTTMSYVNVATSKALNNDADSASKKRKAQVKLENKARRKKEKIQMNNQIKINNSEKFQQQHNLNLQQQQQKQLMSDNLQHQQLLHDSIQINQHKLNITLGNVIPNRSRGAYGNYVSNV